MASSGGKRFGLTWLIAAAVLPTLLWQLPYGHYVLFPFSVLATWFHEMGHGLTALLLGGSFHKLELFWGGGGLASTGASGRIPGALVSAGGLMGPPIAGFFFLNASTRAATARLALWLLGGLMLFSVAVWVRTLFGCVAVSLIGTGLLLLARRGSVEVQAFCVKLIGVQACISAYRSRGYMFSDEVTIAGRAMHSDTGHIAQQLLLPYWFWGGTLFLASLALLVGGVYLSTVRAADERRL
ncbi:M50 family peptidase [bacterium]|nr:MAG: M50 family peptidase [bacterium]